MLRSTLCAVHPLTRERCLQHTLWQSSPDKKQRSVHPLPPPPAQTLRFGTSQQLGGNVYGTTPRACGFGTARQRPENVCGSASMESPGPVYLPHKEFTSTTASIANVK